MTLETRGTTSFRTPRTFRSAMTPGAATVLGAVTVLAAVSLWTASQAEGTKPDPAKAEPEKARSEYEMTTFQLVFLKDGPSKEELGKEEAANRQKTHLDGLKDLMARRKALIVGPVEDGGDIRGVVVLDVQTPEEASKLLENDPYVRSRHLILEVHPWFAAKGIFQEPKEFLDLTDCFLGLLKRPKDAPQLPEEKLKELQAGHMANIQRMAASGDLVIAGPMKDDGALRGIFIFRTPSAERVKELVAQDPAVKAHRLEMELYTWHVSKGVLPPPPAASKAS